MKFAASGPLNAEAIAVDRTQDPVRVLIRCGSIRLALTPNETIALATRLIDLLAELRETERTAQ